MGQTEAYRQAFMPEGRRFPTPTEATGFRQNIAGLPRDFADVQPQQRLDFARMLQTTGRKWGLSSRDMVELAARFMQGKVDAPDMGRIQLVRPGPGIQTVRPEIPVVPVTAPVQARSTPNLAQRPNMPPQGIPVGGLSAPYSPFGISPEQKAAQIRAQGEGWDQPAGMVSSEPQPFPYPQGIPEGGLSAKYPEWLLRQRRARAGWSR